MGGGFMSVRSNVERRVSEEMSTEVERKLYFSLSFCTEEKRDIVSKGCLNAISIYFLLAFRFLSLFHLSVSLGPARNKKISTPPPPKKRGRKSTAQLRVYDEMIHEMIIFF